VQVEVLPIADRHVEKAVELAGRLRDAGLRVEVNEERETTGNKIRKAWRMKVPYMVIMGDKEIESGALSVRTLSGRDERGVEEKSLVDRLLEEIASKAVAPGRE
jgi:threonyl-tRNA synthetase